MSNFKLWSVETEKKFFVETLKNFASPEKLFYKFGEEYFAYIKKGQKNNGQTLQSRNSLIGQFTEKWCKDLLNPIAKKLNLYAVNNVVCKEIGLTKRSNADLAFCTTDSSVQVPQNIKIIFEIKMSIISNYKYSPQNNILEFIGDYKSHKGTPSLLRSDSMLKAIGKSINIRVYNKFSTKIPIIILGNSPINKSYENKVDFLKKSGVIQGFLSLYPNPTKSEFIKNTKEKGFQTIFSVSELHSILCELLENDMNYFSSMISKQELGKIISLANQEKSEIEKAEKFLSLIRN
ncbi:MAG: hypothetical protein B6D62_02750 [Candidatus Cloacimonas sp. 4484_275]|nr:MAG: hypothetical protein B6D62_02750 [Candidatus Cloacimonas sp. 4484_275]